ncbi:phage tail length tape measure family protein [Oxalobacteraceae bacterium]|nr:phage tail length tape measure family protein [Oxalobacteraceae bacterium]
MSDQIGAASIRLALDSSGVDAGLNRMEASVTQTGRSLSNLGRTGAAAISNMSAGADASATTFERAAQRRIRSLQLEAVALESGGRATRQYQEASARAYGGDALVNAIRPQLDALDQIRARQDAAAQAALRGGAAFQGNAQSAAALAASLRQVPAQLTDIVTSLQGGQAPLTVFLQQGGQLRDMFGSAGGAARALGGYLISLVSPLKVLMAAVAVTAVAYKQGADEADAYAKAIILTGNAAGVTTNQLANMAKQGAAVAGTQSANAEALAQLVGTGKVGADELLRASTTAVQSQKYLGIAVEDTVKAFADLGKDPLQATLKLNDQYNYLTESTYRQIKALTEQGKTSEAAKVAQNALAEAQDANIKKVKALLGPYEKAWKDLGEAAKQAWGFMVDQVREDTLDEKIASAQKKLERAKRAYYAFAGTTAEKDADRDDAQRQLDRLQNQKKVAEVQATSDADRIKQLTAIRKLDEDGVKYLGRQAQLDKEIALARTLVQDAAPRWQDATTTEEQVQKRIALIRSTYADYFNQSIEGQIAAVERLGAVQEEQAKRALIPIQANQDAGLNKALDQQFAYIDKIAKADEEALVREKSRLQQRLAFTAQETVGIDDQAAHQQKLADLNSQIAVKNEQIANRRKQRDADIFVADVKNTHEAAESYKALYDSRVADLNALDQQVQAQNDQNAALGLSTKQLEALNTGLVEEKASRLEVQASIIANTQGREDEAEVLRKTAARMRELNVAQIEGARKAADLDAYKTFWDSIDRAAQSAFSNIGEGGKSMLDRLRDSLKSGLLDLLYQLTVKQFIINVKANISSDGFGAIANALGGSSGSAGGSNLFGTAANLFSMGETIYSGFSAGIASSMGGAISTLGETFGSAAMSSFGAGMSMTTAEAASAVAAANAAAAGTAAAGSTATAGSALSAGASTAASIPYIGWIIAGMMANDGFFKQGYRIDNQKNDITKEMLASTFKGNFFGPIGAAMTAAIGAGDAIPRKLGFSDRMSSLISGSSLWTKGFGHQSPTIESQGIEGTINTQGVTATNFANVLEKGGWFRSDKRTSFTDPLNADADTSFDATVQAMVASVKGFGKAMGEQTTQIDSYTKAFKLNLTGDATKDQALITDLFVGVGNDLSTLLVPSIAKLKQESENASQTLQRVAGDYIAIDGALGAIGQRFAAVGVSSLEARENLLALSGGLDNFVSKAEFFSQNYLSESERVAAVSKVLTQSFTDLGVTAIPKTRDEFKALVQGLDLTDEGSRKMYAGLMGLEEVFAQVTPQIDHAAVALAQQNEQRQLDVQLMAALGNAEGALAATRADALAALLSDQARITQSQIYAAQDAKKAFDALAGAGDSALSGLSKSLAVEKERLNAAYSDQAEAVRVATQASVDNAQKSLQAAQTQVAALQTVFGALESALGSSKIESDSATLARRQAAQTVLTAAAANPRDLGNNKALAAAIGAVSGQSNARLFGTFEEYARDQARTNNVLATLRAAAGDQIDYAEKTVDTLNDTIEAIQKSGSDQLVQLQRNSQAELEKLDLALTNATAQLEALKGINNSVLSLKDAMAVFASAIAGLKSNPTAAANGASVVSSSNVGAGATSIEGLYESVLGRHSDAEGLAHWTAILTSGKSLEEIRQGFIGSDEYKKLRGFAVGTNRVPFDMPANIHADERIIPAADNRQLMALMARATDPGQSSEALLVEVKRLNGMVEAQQRTLDMIAANSGLTSEVLDAAQKGRPLAYREVV